MIDPQLCERTLELLDSGTGDAVWSLAQAVIDQAADRPDDLEVYQHPLGFLKTTLVRVENRSLRLHVWPVAAADV